MNEIVFKVEQEEDCLVATWDDPKGGGIATQGESVPELIAMIRDAAAGYFRAAGIPTPKRVRLHFVNDPELVLA
ncbi:MAG: 2-oxoisovalerate dehydrogenase [Verrucomicrobia bacterium]|nr:2-oxoisovalerate dehydrogenase [Verrucomicrobiota bacterium]